MKDKIFASFLIFLFALSPVPAQRAKTVKQKPKSIIFAVVNDGKWIEPIAVVDKGELSQASGGDDESAKIVAFTKTYYAPKTNYRLIFGGVDAGTVAVKKSDPKSECAGNIAEVTVVSKTAKLGGMVMGLATNLPMNKAAKGFRRKPTPAERAEIESLVRAEFTKQKAPASASKTLHSHNLTALDADGDGKAELIGSYWVETAPTERALLFFIADEGKSGKYSFGYSEFNTFKQDDVMSRDIKDLDGGIYSELLLDVLDYNGDNVGEIFTQVQSFESTAFNAYKRENGKWTKAFEGANYHCGY